MLVRRERVREEGDIPTAVRAELRFEQRAERDELERVERRLISEDRGRFLDLEAVGWRPLAVDGSETVADEGEGDRSVDGSYGLSPRSY